MLYMVTDLSEGWAASFLVYCVTQQQVYSCNQTKYVLKPFTRFSYITFINELANLVLHTVEHVAYRLSEVLIF